MQAMALYWVAWHDMTQLAPMLKVKSVHTWQFVVGVLPCPVCGTHGVCGRTLGWHFIEVGWALVTMLRQYVQCRIS